MVVELKIYDSASEVANALEEELAKTKSRLGEYLRRLDEIRILAERSKKLHEMVLKMAKEKMKKESLGEVRLGDVHVVLNANPFQELTAIEEVVRSQQEKLMRLQKIRETLKWLDQIEETPGIKYLVLENDKIPVKILLKIT